MSDEKITGLEWARFIAGTGILLLIYTKVVPSAPRVVGWAAMDCLIVAVPVWFASGGSLSGKELYTRGGAPEPRCRAGHLAGSRIITGGQVFTILDESTPALPAVVANDGRAMMVAADEAGRVSQLFLGFDRSGRVIEASPGGGGWSQARLAG